MNGSIKVSIQIVLHKFLKVTWNKTIWQTKKMAFQAINIDVVGAEMPSHYTKKKRKQRYQNLRAMTSKILVLPVEFTKA